MVVEVPARTRVWAEIDLSALRRNLRVVRERIGSKPQIIAVVKANAYGHGVKRVVPAIRDLAQIFAVANLDEAIEVREVETERDILLLGPCLPAEREEVVERGFIATVSSAEEARAFAYGQARAKARLNLKIDTGMGRIGVWHESGLSELSRIVALSGAELHSVSTHLPSADEDVEFTKAQNDLFDLFVRHARRLAPEARYHILNSAGVCGFPKYAFDLVRVGLMLYGSTSVPDYQPFLDPPLVWKTRILLVRDVGPGRSISYGRTFVTDRRMRVATVAAGYADGYPRQVSGKGACVLIGGVRCPLLGRVTMDQFVVDVSELPSARPGDEAVLIGRQAGEQILAGELAAKADTIAWHIFTGIGGRTERFYFSSEVPFRGGA